jgi:hypothetical protein
VTFPHSKAKTLPSQCTFQEKNEPAPESNYFLDLVNTNKMSISESSVKTNIYKNTLHSHTLSLLSNEQ